MVFAFDEFVLDTRAFELTYRGRSVSLQKRPLDLLTYLVVHRDRVVTKAEILSEVWGGVRVTENALVQAIANVRGALGARGMHAIRSVRCRGYRFVLAVELIGEDVADPSAPQLVPRETLRVAAHSRESMGTWRTLLKTYADARRDTMIEGTPLARALARATTRDEIVALVLALFADKAQSPAVLVIDHLERADLESVLLYAALVARPRASLVIHGTCAWAGVPHGSPVARLLRRGLDGAPEFAA